MEYDEIRITTRREIHICRAAIKKLETFIGQMESRYELKSTDFMNNFSLDRHPSDHDLSRWHDSYLALQRWRARLSAHQQIMEL